MTTQFLDQRTASPRPNDMWPVHLVKKADLDRHLQSLGDGPAGPDGRREVVVAHPKAVSPGLGLAPGTEVVFGLLLPGEATVTRRHNSGEVLMVLTGAVRADIGAASFELRHRDTCNIPSMLNHTLRNDGTDAATYVMFSNRPVLQKLEVYFNELDPPSDADESDGLQAAGEFSAKIARAKEMAEGFAIGEEGGWLLPYEHLVDPEFVESNPLKWAWDDVAPHLGILTRLGQGYTGRPLLCLYNPATGSRNGTTFNFFATIANAAPNLVGPAHRHNSSAINFILDGSGYSIVDGTKVEWQAGDIMLSAPGWAPHGHATGPDGAVILTIQDHPFHIGCESLIWQEDLQGGPILSLGKQAGFQTNLVQFADV